MKRMIVNADDFGFSEAVNHGILKAMQEGIVTSTSIMAKHSFRISTTRLNFNIKIFKLIIF